MILEISLNNIDPMTRAIYPQGGDHKNSKTLNKCKFYSMTGHEPFNPTTINAMPRPLPSFTPDLSTQ